MFRFSKHRPYQQEKKEKKKTKVNRIVKQMKNKMETTCYHPKQWYGFFYNAMGRRSYCTSTGLCRIKGN